MGWVGGVNDDAEFSRSWLRFDLTNNVISSIHQSLFVFNNPSLPLITAHRVSINIMTYHN